MRMPLCATYGIEHCLTLAVLRTDLYAKHQPLTSVWPTSCPTPGMPGGASGNCQTHHGVRIVVPVRRSARRRLSARKSTDMHACRRQTDLRACRQTGVRADRQACVQTDRHASLAQTERHAQEVTAIHRRLLLLIATFNTTADRRR